MFYSIAEVTTSISLCNVGIGSAPRSRTLSQLQLQRRAAVRQPELPLTAVSERAGAAFYSDCYTRAANG
jgi:hypothetical protein